MFEKNSELDIQNRLSVLHVLEKYNKPIERDFLINFFLIAKLYNFLEINDILKTLQENNLIVENSGIISLSEHGIVVHSFFIDKLPYDKQKELERLMYDTSIFEEKFHNIIKKNKDELKIMLAQGKKIKLDMIIDTDLIPNIDGSKFESKEFYEDIIKIIKKHLIQNEL